MLQQAQLSKIAPSTNLIKSFNFSESKKKVQKADQNETERNKNKIKCNHIYVQFISYMAEYFHLLPPSMNVNPISSSFFTHFQGSNCVRFVYEQKGKITKDIQYKKVRASIPVRYIKDFSIVLCEYSMLKTTVLINKSTTEIEWK